MHLHQNSNNGLQDGSLDLSKLMGTVQSMVSNLNSQNSETNDNKVNDDAMNMINSMMGGLTKQKDGNESESGYGDQNQMPDISGIMGPLLNSLGGASGGAGGASGGASGGAGGMPDLVGMLGGLSGGNKLSIEEDIDSQVAKIKSKK